MGDCEGGKGCIRGTAAGSVRVYIRSPGLLGWSLVVWCAAAQVRLEQGEVWALCM